MNNITLAKSFRLRMIEKRFVPYKDDLHVVRADRLKGALDTGSGTMVAADRVECDFYAPCGAHRGCGTDGRGMREIRDVHALTCIVLKPALKHRRDHEHPDRRTG